MKAHYYRKEENGDYLVPVEHIEGFDKCILDIEDAGLYSDRWYELTDLFNNLYEQYNQEGVIGAVLLFIE